MAVIGVGAAMAETVVINSSTKRIIASGAYDYDGYNYRCTSGTVKSCASGYVKLTYTLSCKSDTSTCTAQSCGSGGGTCVCPYNSYYISSSGSCASCYGGARAVSPTVTTDTSLYHTATSCNYCDYDKYLFTPSGQTQKVCTNCPSDKPYSDGQTCKVGSNCSAGYYNGPNAVCTKCPGNYVTSPGGKIGIDKCCITKGTKLNDSLGTYEYTTDCCYK